MYLCGRQRTCECRSRTQSEVEHPRNQLRGEEGFGGGGTQPRRIFRFRPAYSELVTREARWPTPTMRRKPSGSSNDIPDPVLAERYLGALADDLQDSEFPPEVRSLGRTLKRWMRQICNWTLARASNGPAEAINNLVKRVKRVAFGFRRFRNYRIRSLLYAGRPDWNLLATITPH